MSTSNSPSMASDPSPANDLDHPNDAGVTEPIDPVLLDEEENALEDGIADNPVASPTQPYTQYNDLKKYKGQLYSGMAIGGSHTWNYDPGTWKETKEEPDLWRIEYQTNKRRARNAPRGSGAAPGTEYHWLIVAHQVRDIVPAMSKIKQQDLMAIQHVRKIDANTYETKMTGSKYKLAHKSVTARSWSIPTVREQRQREMDLLDDARRRVQGLPPVLSSEKVRVDRREKGQQSLDALLNQATAKQSGSKRKKVA
ncbi:hypothetical protein N7492_006691 [Penicillium capsulatum]|uniref:Uncharacterized protein n=1 Tax=Penicillium capsulatum TaxID=69766 RepID=A0A9W9LKY3_9EURO|nr:hypothetical protein N7492_006691 [Penicillium capsulatum]KAJ6116527.1 hypothetical protein N7512_006252 [Penicillium capsulatum]